LCVEFLIKSKLLLKELAFFASFFFSHIFIHDNKVIINKNYGRKQI